MPDIIRLLPDSVANQIAAGEVIQRPASVVKELVENSIDSGATSIEIIIKDAGKTLIKVIDNGSGMSETDARLSFERHATSKIKEANDLFQIRTMGFRGEALASIAAIAQVELKTKRKEDNLGSIVMIEASKIKTSEPSGSPDGTSIAVKNLFFNVPARRAFLKSDNIEFNHICEELIRIALPNFRVAFKLLHNDKEIYNLPVAGSLKQRISNIFAKNYSEKIVPIEQATDYVKIQGFISKPEFAKKVRGEQYFFVNNRFIKHNYFNHSLVSAYTDLIPAGLYPSYFVFFETDPQNIDINIHPTKTEIKFTDEKLVYAFLFSSAKRSLGVHNITPSLDFDTNPAFTLPYSYKDKTPVQPQTKLDPDYNPYKHNGGFIDKPLNKINIANWEKLYAGNVNLDNNKIELAPQLQLSKNEEVSKQSDNIPIQQLNVKYILTRVKSGILIVDIKRALQRINYEKFLYSLENQKLYSQQQLYPEQLDFLFEDAQILRELKNDIELLGFSISEFGPNSFVVNGIPSGSLGVRDVLEGFIYSYKNNLNRPDLTKNCNLALSLAKNISKVRTGMQELELQNIIDSLFACQVPDTSPDGDKVYIIINYEEIESKLDK